MIYERSSTDRATAVVASLDAIEPEFTTFVRRCALLLDPSFPQSGWRNQTHQGQWKSADQVTTIMQEAEDLDEHGRGLQLVRTVVPRDPGDPHEGAFRVIAVGLVDDAKLELWWEVVATATEVRGVSLELSVEGTAAPACVTAFRDWLVVRRDRAA